MREEKLKAINQRKREEKEASKMAEKKSKIKPLSAKKQKIENPKVEKEVSDALPKKEKAAPKKRDPAPPKLSSSFGSHSFLIEEFSKRWNYALPSYPPSGYDYKKDLVSKKLHLVSAQDFNRLKFEVPNTKKKSEIPVGF